MVNRNAYFLKKGNKKMSQFFFSQLELQEKYSDKLSQDEYTIGKMQYSHIESKDEREYITLWTDDCGLGYNKRGHHFYANYEDCWGEIPETWNTKIEIDKRDIIEKTNSTTVKIAPKARIRNLGKYTNESLKELKKKYRQDFLEDLKQFMVSKNRIRLYVNSAGADLIESGWCTVSCFFETENRSPSTSDYIIELDMDKVKAGYQRGSIQADGTHHIKIIGKVSNED